MNNLVLIESKTLREEHINKVEILEKVKTIEYMTGDMIVSVKQAADYYETPITTIRSIINDHREEFENDGLRTLSGSKLDSFKGSTGNPLTLKYVSQFTIIPRKALLRIGMLLRDSKVAVKVRDYLLEAEMRRNEFTPEIALKTFREIKKVLDEVGATAEAKLETTKNIFSKAGIEIPITYEEIRKSIASGMPNPNTKPYLNQKLVNQIMKDHNWGQAELANYVGTSRNHVWRLMSWNSSVGKKLKKKLMQAFPQYQDLLFVEVDESII